MIHPCSKNSYCVILALRAVVFAVAARHLMCVRRGLSPCSIVTSFVIVSIVIPDTHTHTPVCSRSIPGSYLVHGLPGFATVSFEFCFAFTLKGTVEFTGDFNAWSSIQTWPIEMTISCEMSLERNMQFLVYQPRVPIFTTKIVSCYELNISSSFILSIKAPLRTNEFSLRDEVFTFKNSLPAFDT